MSELPTFEILQTIDENEYRLEICLPIYNFSDYMSPDFLTDDYAKLKVLVKHISDEDDDIIKIGLKAGDFIDVNSELKIWFRMKIYNRKKEKLYYRETLNATLSEVMKSVFSNKIRRPIHGDAQNYFNGETYFYSEYVILCHVRIENLNDLKFITEPITKNISQKCIYQLQQDFRALLNESQMKDVSLTLDNNVIIRAHKCVLSCRSLVFRKMFEIDMKESSQSNVNLLDIEKSVAEAFLLFFYTGMVECNDFNSLITLYSLANIYQVKTLKMTCCAILVSKIKNETVFPLFKLAHLHNDTYFENTVVDFLYQNFQEVEASIEWQEFLESERLLSALVLKQVASRIGKNVNKC